MAAFIDAVVDHAVHAHIYVAAGGAVARGGIGAHVEADDDRFGGGGQHHVALIDGADAGMDYAYAHLFVGQLFKGLLDCLGAALYVGLDDQAQFFHFAGTDLAE